MASWTAPSVAMWAVWTVLVVMHRAIGCSGGGGGEVVVWRCVVESVVSMVHFGDIGRRFDGDLSQIVTAPISVGLDSLRFACQQSALDLAGAIAQVLQ